MLATRRLNNFDAVRLALAVAVVNTHIQYIMPGDYGWLTVVERAFNGTTAVDCFFVISGFLIFGSLRRSGSLAGYLRRRVRRIYPGLAACVLVSAAAGACITTASPATYLAGGGRYVACNLVFATFLQQSLPGVFADAPHPYVNGALWTLKIEVMFYLFAPALAWLVRRAVPFPALGLMIYTCSIAYRMVCVHLATTTGDALYGELGRQLPGQMSFFIVGGLVEYGAAYFRRHARRLLAAALAALMLCALTGAAYPLYPAALGIAVLYVCIVLRPGPRAARYGDFSYGLYVWHFPVIQTVLATGLASEHPALRAALAAVCCGAAAVLSWHWVERPWLGPPSHRVTAAAPPLQHST